MAFEKFVEAGKSFKPKLSIRTNGQLGLNQGAVKRYNLEEKQYVVLFFDSESRRIGLKFTVEPEEGAVKYKVRQMNVSIPAKSFLDYYGIEYSTSAVARVDVQYDEEAGMLVAQI